MITPSFKKSLTRLFKDMVVADAWNDMVKRLQDIHKAIKEDVESRRFDLSYKTHSIVDSLRDQTEVSMRCFPYSTKVILTQDNEGSNSWPKEMRKQVSDFGN